MVAGGRRASSAPVVAVVAGGRVEEADHVDAVAAHVHRHVDRHLDVVAGADARRVRGVTAGLRAAVRPAVAPRAAVSRGGTAALVGAGVAHRRVEDAHHVHRVAADVHRHVHRGLHRVAGEYAGRTRTRAVRTRVRVGAAARGGDHTRGRRHRHQALAGDLSHLLNPLPCLVPWYRECRECRNSGASVLPPPRIPPKGVGPGAHGVHSGADGIRSSRGEAQRHLLTQTLPKAGFSRPITEIVLPQTFTGTCTGT